jgi:hypothetical protein
LAAAAHEAGFDLHYAIVRHVALRRGWKIGGYTELKFGRFTDYGSAEAAAKAVSTPEMVRKRAIRVIAGSITEAFLNDHQADRDASAAADVDTAVEYAAMTMQPNPSDANRVVAKYLRDRDLEAYESLATSTDAIQRVANACLER